MGAHRWRSRKLAPAPDSSLYPLKNGDVPNGLTLSVSRISAQTSTVLRFPKTATSETCT